MDTGTVLRFQMENISSERMYQVTYITPHRELRVGETILQLASEDEQVNFSAPCGFVVVNFLVHEGMFIQLGSPIAEVISPYFTPSTQNIENFINRQISDQIWGVAIAANAAIKGLLGSMGESGQIASRTVPIQTELPMNGGVLELLTAISDACLSSDTESGDVIVLAEKPFAVAQGRLIPLSIIQKHDPKKLDILGRQLLLQEISALVDTPVDDGDLILMDWYTTDQQLGPMATVGANNHNRLAHQAAEAIFEKCGKSVDVVISDTDTGIDVRKTLIGTITLGATPLGATKGLSVYECMRAACAAEFTRGSTRRIPIVICKPATRCRERPHLGEYRGYDGKLQFEREGLIAFA